MPGLNEVVGGALSILDPCSRCSFQDQQLANRCCQQGNRRCCSFLQPVGPQIGGFPGQFGGPGQFGNQFGQSQFGGQFGQNQFGGQFGQNQFGPPGVSVGGTKPGICPQLGGVQSGFSRFAGAQCVAECRSDFECVGIQKCCQVGCSSICRAPQGGKFSF